MKLHEIAEKEKIEILPSKVWIAYVGTPDFEPKPSSTSVWMFDNEKDATALVDDIDEYHPSLEKDGHYIKLACIKPDLWFVFVDEDTEFASDPDDVTLITAGFDKESVTKKARKLIDEGEVQLGKEVITDLEEECYVVEFDLVAEDDTEWLYTHEDSDVDYDDDDAPRHRRYRQEPDDDPPEYHGSYDDYYSRH